MFLNFIIVNVDEKYCDYLRKYDGLVPLNHFVKEKRPFIGILFQIHNVEYFAPLSSPKAKHLKMKNMLDFVKIDHGRLGVINFNNMIPVTSKNYAVVDLDDTNPMQLKYMTLLKKQLHWLNENKSKIIYKADSLYALYIAKLLPKRIAQRCCNFPLLEEKCVIYNQEKENNYARNS